MSLRPQEAFSVPDETRRVALAAFPKGCACLRIGDVLGCVYQDKQFEGLSQTAGGDFQATLASGAAVLGQAGVGGNGSITGGSGGGFNVDLSTPFSTMIVAQQGYEANAKVLTTMDQVSQATIALIQ